MRLVTALRARAPLWADGREFHPMCRLTTRSVAEPKGRWDVSRPVRTVPADQAWRPLGESGCPPVKG